MASPQELVTAARCYDCIPAGYRDAVVIYLQDAILAGGGGGSPEVFALVGSDVPVAVPAGAAGVAYNEAGDVWVYSVGATWDKIISA